MGAALAAPAHPRRRPRHHRLHRVRPRRAVLALPPATAWALPVAVDSYVLAALRSARDVPAALAVMAGALAASMGAHLAAADLPPGQRLPAAVTAPAAAAIMTVLVAVAWRVHVLVDHAAERTRALATATAPPSMPVHAGPSAPEIHSAADAPVSALGAAGNDRRSPARARRAPATRPAIAASDEQILAAITGPPPSVRALMRTHAIRSLESPRHSGPESDCHNHVYLADCSFALLFLRKYRSRLCIVVVTVWRSLIKRDGTTARRISCPQHRVSKNQ